MLVPRHLELLYVVLAIAAADPAPDGMQLSISLLYPGTRLSALYTAKPHRLSSVLRILSLLI